MRRLDCAIVAAALLLAATAASAETQLSVASGLLQVASPTADVLIPSASAISGYRKPSSRRNKQRCCCSDKPWMA